MEEFSTAFALAVMKSQADLARGLWNNKDNEAQYIHDCLEEIKDELATHDHQVKLRAIDKLLYLQMFGYSVGATAEFKILESVSQSGWSYKRIGYLAACKIISSENEIILLSTGLMRRDFLSRNMYDTGLALHFYVTACNPILARDLVPDIVSMMNSSRPYVRKRSVLAMCKVFSVFPDSLKPCFSRFRERFDDPDPGVVSAAVYALCELCCKDASMFLPLAPVLYRLLTSPNSDCWMLTKIVKLFSAMMPLEPRIARALAEPLVSIINRSEAWSLVFECIRACIVGLSNHASAMRSCVKKLAMFIENPDRNLKYLGLVSLNDIGKINPRYLLAHRDLVLRCLDDEDETIRRKALELVPAIVDKKNLAFVMDKLKCDMERAEGAYKDELVEKILFTCSKDKFACITDIEWYLSFLVDLTKVEGIRNGKSISNHILNICLRVRVIRPVAFSLALELLEEGPLVIKNPARKATSEALAAAALIVGEYVETSSSADPFHVICRLLVPETLQLDERIQSMFLFSVVKLLGLAGAREERAVLVNCLSIIKERLPFYMSSLHTEVQERACLLNQLVALLENPDIDAVRVCSELRTCASEVLHPVGPSAIFKVKVPEGLDLDASLFEGNVPTEEEAELEGFLRPLAGSSSS